MRKNNLILSIFLIAMMLTSIAPNLNAKVFVSPGTKVFYKVKIFDYGTLKEKDVWFEVKEVKKVVGKNYIYWVNSEGKNGSWLATKFGNPIVEPGDKWTYINVDFYIMVSSYIDDLKEWEFMGYKAKYDFVLEYKYWVVFKGLPRWGKRFAFWGKVIQPGGAEILEIVRDVTYLSNGIALKMYYKYAFDNDSSGYITDNEVYYEEWTLVDWNRPIFDAISPILVIAFGIIVFIGIVLVIRRFVRKHMEKVQEIWRRSQI